MLRASILFILFAFLLGCSPKRETISPAPSPSASAVSTSTAQSDKVVPMSEEDMFRVARVIMNTLEQVTADGEFEALRTVEDIRVKTDASNNVRWRDFVAGRAKMTQVPVAYKSSLGNFLSFHATPSREGTPPVGLIVWLPTRKVSIYTIDGSSVVPTGDFIAGALAVGLVTEAKVKDLFSSPPTAAELNARTIRNIDHIISELSSPAATFNQGATDSSSATSSSNTGQSFWTTGVLMFEKGLGVPELKSRKANIKVEIICGKMAGEEMCTSTNVLADSPPITVSSGLPICKIDGGVFFTIKENVVAGVSCHILEELAHASRDLLTKNYGNPKSDIKSVASLTTEEYVWTKDSFRYSIIHMTGHSLAGQPMNDFMVSVKSL